MMQKWACGLTYLGSQYHGWQKQPTITKTVESNVVEALSSIASHPVDIVCAGRTDAGVHALNQVIHFSSDADRKPDNWLLGANRVLPPDIKLQWVVPVDDGFHARYSATSRRYCYVIYNAPLSNPWLEGRVVWLPKRLQHIEAMQEAAKSLIGEHDFSSFRDQDCQARHPIRTISSFELVKHKHFCVFYCEANAFLHHMVRNMMGVLIDVGLGRQSVSWVKQVLAARDRSAAGVTAPPTGLYLADVRYGKPWSGVFPAPLQLQFPLLSEV